MRKLSFIPSFLTAFAAFTACAAISPAPVSPAELQWKLAAGVRMEDRDGKRILVAELPPGAPKGASALAVAQLPVKKLYNLPLRISVPARWENVEQWNSIVLRVEYVSRAGLKVDPSQLPQSRPESMPWTELAITPSILTFGNYATDGPVTLSLGIQGGGGKVEFDMSKLVFELEETVSDADANYQCEYSDAVRNMPRARGVMGPNRMMTDDDFRTLRDWNVNLVRFQFKPMPLSEQAVARLGEDHTDYSVYRKHIERETAELDTALRLGEKYGIKVLIDFHHFPPGGCIPGGELEIFQNQKHVDEFIRIWLELVRRYKGHPALWGYDLINEPFQLHRGVISVYDLQRILAEKIREIDPETPIIFEPNSSRQAANDQFAWLPPLKLRNIIYSPHTYPPVHYFFSAKFPYPGEFRGVPFDREWVKRDLEAIRQFQLAHNAVIYNGEFSVVPWAKGGAECLRDYIEFFEQYGWHYTYHAFREWDGWSLEHEGDSAQTLHPSQDNPRKRVLLEAFSLNGK